MSFLASRSCSVCSPLPGRHQHTQLRRRTMLPKHTMVPADGVVVVIGVVMVVIAGGVLMAGMISVGEGSLTMVSDVSQIKWVWHRFGDSDSSAGCSGNLPPLEMRFPETAS